MNLLETFKGLLVEVASKESIVNAIKKNKYV